MAGFRVQKWHIFGHFLSQPPLGNFIQTYTLQQLYFTITECKRSLYQANTTFLQPKHMHMHTHMQMHTYTHRYAHLHPLVHKHADTHTCSHTYTVHHKHSHPMVLHGACGSEALGTGHRGMEADEAAG